MLGDVKLAHLLLIPILCTNNSSSTIREQSFWQHWMIVERMLQGLPIRALKKSNRYAQSAVGKEQPDIGLYGDFVALTVVKWNN